MDCASCGTQTPPAARFCPSCGATTGSAGSAAERKLVTVVFCDLVGSTALSETLDPEALRLLMLRYFAAMREQIERYGGTVEKYIGDAVMAVFGVPVMHEDDAGRAVAATVGMREALVALNADVEPSLGIRLRVRIGVHTGPVVAGTEISAGQALVSGRTVNVAARLQQHAGEDETLIGPLTRQAIGPAVEAEPIGPLRVKGVQAPVTAYRLLSLSDDAPELLRRFDVPFVGRRRELAELSAILARVATIGAPCLLTVYGEPGIGKTRLMRVWLDGAGRDAVHGVGRCRPYGEHGSLAPLAEAVRGLLSALSRPGRPGASVPRTGDAAALAVLDAGLLRDGTPGHSVDATCAALARLVATVSRAQPVIVVLDDCHWATDPLLDMVGRLAAGAAGAVLFVCLARQDLLDRRPDWARRSSTLSVSGLSADESSTVAGTLAEVSAHAAPAVAAIADRAGGNPFYLEQLVAAAQAGPSPPDDPVGVDALPPTLQSLLGARLDALDPIDRTILEAAAVWGREFTTRQVAALAPGGEPVAPVLARLARRRMIEPATPADGPRGRENHPDAATFRFCNGLICDATYHAMAKRARVERHECIAELLTGDRAPAAEIAGHLERAYRFRAELRWTGPSTEDVRRRAARLLGEAGASALTRSDLAWGENLLARARALLAVDEPGWAAVSRQLGEALITLGRTAPGRDLLEEVVDSGSDPVETAHARLSLAAVDEAGADRAASLARTVLPVFRSAGDGLGLARVGVRIAQASQLHGRHGDAVGRLWLALHHAVRSGAEAERALALGAVGISLWRGPTPVPDAIRRCRTLLHDHGRPRPTVRVTLNCPLAVLFALDGRPGDADEALAEAGRLVAELGYAEGEVFIPIFAAAVESAIGRPEDALRHLDRAAAAAPRLAAGHRGAIAAESARLLLDLGRSTDAAERLARDGVAVGAGALPRSHRADLDGLRSRLMAGRGAATEAHKLAASAIAAAAETDSPLVQAVAALDRAETLRLLGCPGAAARSADQARQRFEAKGYRFGADRARRLVASLGVTGRRPNDTSVSQRGEEIADGRHHGPG